MADLPKIVRRRLRQEPGEVHPDADLLTAFAEQALGERERAQVLAHLAACAACREVVALARPQEEAEAAAAAPRGLRGWVLRWQTAAALAAVTVAAIVLLTVPDSYFRSTHTSVQVAKAPAETTAAREEGSAAANAPAAPEAEASSTPAPARSATLAPGKKEAAGQAGGLGGGTVSALAKAERERRDESKDKLNRGLPASATREAQIPTLAAEPTRQASPPPSAPAYDYKAGAVPATPTYQAKAQPTGAVGGVAAASGVAQPQSEAGKAMVTGAAAADQAQAAGRTRTQAPARAANETVEVSSLLVVAPQWRASAGRLQHSHDAGRSWRTVEVSSDAVWNAVAAVGEHVWVGGHRQREALLYYSSDGGAHWTRLEFMAPAGAQPADVVALNFTDVLHGAMTVVAAEDSRLRRIWTTADGGHTWAAHAAR